MITAKKTTPADVLEMQGHEVSPIKVHWDRLDYTHGITGWDGDTILCVGAIQWLWKGVGEAWIVLHENALEQKVATFRALKEVYGGLLKYHDWWRIQVIVREDWEQARKMVEALGFEPEALMRHYCEDRSNAILYAMVKT